MNQAATPSGRSDRKVSTRISFLSSTLNVLVALPVVSALPSMHNSILAVASNRQCPKLAAALGSRLSYFWWTPLHARMDGQRKS